jgi:hypothetical protein
MIAYFIFILYNIAAYQLINSDINNLARNNKLTAEQVESMVMAAAKSVMKVELAQLCRLGIDEISWR